MIYTVGNAGRGKLGIYLRFLVMLLVITTTILAGIAISGCDDCDNDYNESPETKRTSSQGASYQAKIIATSTNPQPGIAATRVLGGNATGTGSPGPVTFTYHPPEGITQFTANPVPSSGGPPYVWENQSPDQVIQVEFYYPELPAGQSSLSLTEVVQSSHSDGTSSAASLNTHLGSGGSSFSVPASDPTPVAQSDVSPQAINNSWQVSPWIYTHNITMTAGLCQDWSDFLTSENVFAAVRLPVNQPVATQSYAIPIVFGYVDNPSMQLLDESSLPHQAVMTLPIEYRGEHFAFAERNLPSAGGEHWATLGFSDSSGVTCPDHQFPLGPSDWELKPTVYIELNDTPRKLPIYFCYKGKDQPMLSATQQAALRVAQVFGGDVGFSSFQGEGITCVGPHLLQLGQFEGNDGLFLYGSSAASITRTQMVTYHHYLRVNPGMTITFGYTSSLGSLWKLYWGDHAGPDVGRPITGPELVAATGASDAHVWAATQVPVGAADGSHTLYLTASSGGSASTATDMMWVGEWVAPAGGGSQVYLPTLVRN